MPPLTRNHQSEQPTNVTTISLPLPIQSTLTPTNKTTLATMITDAQLYSLAVFLGSAAVLLIVLYHFLEVNAKDTDNSVLSPQRKADAVPAKAR